MKISISAGTLAASLLVGVAAGRPSASVAQESPQAVVGGVAIGREQAGASGLAASCAAYPEDGDAFLAEVSRARELEDADAANAVLDALEPEADRRAAESPDDVTAQYHLAALMGARLDHESGRAKISGAAKLHDQVVRVLELAPEHAGASYMMGRLHASVLRLSGFKRFMATRLLGGGGLKGASWEEAQAHLEVAVRGEPCVPDHHFELARVYAQRGDQTGAERELTFVQELTAAGDGRLARLRERAEEMGRQWREGKS